VHYMMVFNQLIVIPGFYLCKLWFHLVFWDLSSYNPKSKGFPKTDCHTVLKSMSFVAIISWSEIILISGRGIENKVSENKFWVIHVYCSFEV